jgi:microcystin-dependent protein
MPAPIGSIVAYAGPIDTAWETANGWMLCDGRLLDRSDPLYVSLFDAIGFSWGGDLVERFHLPDLGGYFLRGVALRKDQDRDPDSDRRTANHTGGHTGNQVGSVQGWATALPPREQAFVLSDAGRHHHILDFELDATRDVDSVANTVAYPAPSGAPPHTTDTAGLHTHVLTGGHRETRPINAYVHWIIRFQ